MKNYTFSDVLIKPQYSEVLSRSKVDMSSNIGWDLNLTLPIISANMKTITGEKMARAMKIAGGLGILHRFCTIDESVNMFTASNQSHPTTNNPADPFNWAAVSIGVQEEDKARFDALYAAGAKIFCVDVAHGHHLLVKNMLEWISYKSLSDITVIGGNIATAEAAEDLTEWGADVVKVGIGPGSVCQTRQRTGVGYPQLAALQQVKHIIDYMKLDTKIIADGGIVNTGDIAKALKYADAVMIGSLFAGTAETPGNVYRNPDGQFYKVYGGSASAENKGENKFVEGMMKTTPFRGKVKYILREIADGIRSAFSYTGSTNLKEFQSNCEFLEITDNGARESKI